MRISVHIVTKDRSLLLKRCLFSIAHQTDKPDEVIIVDGSRDGNSFAIVREFSQLFTIKHIREHRNSIATARNIAIDHSHCDIVFFVDDDCVLKKDALVRIKHHFGTYKHSVAVIGRVLNAAPANVFASVQHCYYERWLLQNYGNLDTSQRIVGGMAVDFEIMALKRDVFRSMRFDEAIPFGRDEDLEFGVRLFEKKKPNIYFDPAILAYHVPRKTFVEFIKRNFINGFTNQYLYKNKGIDVRRTPYLISWNKFMLLCKRQTKFLPSWSNKLTFVCLLLLYPLISRLGRSTYEMLCSINWLLIRRKIC